MTGNAKTNHESCLFRIIELYHGRFTFRKLSRWKQWECRPGDTDDWYVSIIICPFRFEPHSLKQCPSSLSLSLYTKIFSTLFSPSMYITDQNCRHRRRRLTCRFEYSDEMRSFIKTYHVLCNFIVRVTQRKMWKCIDDNDLLNLQCSL